MHYEKVSAVNEKIKSVSLILGLLALWFFTHPYRGIYHDACLYTVQALSHLFPEAYKNDLFFLYGSQDSYTIFSYIYAYAIKLLGLNTAAITLQIAGHILWFSSACILGRSLLKNSPVFWSFLVFAGVLSRGYGNNLFSYEEQFLTARIFSEAMVLYGIAFLVERKDVFAFIFLLLASVFHPLIGAVGIIFTFIYKAYADRRWLFLSIALLLLTVLAAFWHIRPFSGLLEVMDDNWYRDSHTISAHAFMDTWELEHLNAVLFDACILGSAFMVASGNLRRFFFSSLFTGLTGVLLTAVGTYVFRNVLIIQLQPWRALWLMHLFAYLAGAFLLFELWNRSKFSRLLLSAYLTSWFLVSLVPFSGILVILIFCLHYLTMNKDEKRFRVPWFVERLCFWTLLVSGIIWLYYWCLFAYIKLLRIDDVTPFTRYISVILVDTKLFLILGFLSIRSFIANTENKAILTTSLAVSLLCIIGAFSIWDQRPGQEKVIEENALTGKIFANKIPSGSVVCWPDYFFKESSIKKVWFMLGTSSYADPTQAVGIIFSKDTAMKYFQRTKRLESLGFHDLWHREASENDTIPKPAFHDLVHVCSDPELDYVVLDFKYPYGAVDSYYDEHSKKKYFLYDCEVVRRH